MNLYPIETSIEGQAAMVIRAGRQFAYDWKGYPKLADAAGTVEQTTETIGRLVAGDVFNQLDDASFDHLESELAHWLNSINPKFCELAMNGRTGEAIFNEDEQTKEVRQLIFKYLSFRTARQAVMDRVAADRAIKQLYNGCTDLGSTSV
ncbi:hypothetical protein DL239_15345 [Sedimentitalea sp. CY04]|uniref:Uncharacterized protein n=1 Tax=Parasedimentitalea denitrificans TaxID=2211118 RepID=A0ABX0W9P9_9RHOB|nr:hypothetical protein [Sedimentitalea sp. CY04]NIZ62347.1 hypothetical protein [Sedimentitalea sp. CY04]